MIYVDASRTPRTETTTARPRHHSPVRGSPRPTGRRPPVPDPCLHPSSDQARRLARGRHEAREPAPGPSARYRAPRRGAPRSCTGRLEDRALGTGRQDAWLRAQAPAADRRRDRACLFALRSWSREAATCAAPAAGQPAVQARRSAHPVPPDHGTCAKGSRRVRGGRSSVKRPIVSKRRRSASNRAARSVSTIVSSTPRNSTAIARSSGPLSRPPLGAGAGIPTVAWTLETID
jgi:hypothetical protein